MRTMRWMTGSLVGLALVAGSISPAEARPRYHGGYGGWDRHHRHHDGFGFGDAVGVAALIGAVAIVASSVSKDKQASQARADDAPPPPRDGAGYDDDAPPPRNGTDYGTDIGDRGSAAVQDNGAARDETAMTDACAIAARDEAQDAGGYAEVRHMDAPMATASGFNIDGEVETRASWSAHGGSTRRFTCSMQDGRVADVYLARDVAAAR